MRRLVGFIGVGLLAALVLGACGGGGGPSGPERAVIDQAEEICLNAQDKVGRTLGDDPEVDRDAVREATDQLMAISAPSQNRNAWTLFVQSTNNLWITLDDVYQSQLPEVNDKARADRARETVVQVNDNVKKYAADYNMEECSKGYGRAARDS